MTVIVVEVPMAETFRLRTGNIRQHEARKVQVCISRMELWKIDMLFATPTIQRTSLRSKPPEIVK